MFVAGLALMLTMSPASPAEPADQMLLKSDGKSVAVLFLVEEDNIGSFVDSFLESSGAFDEQHAGKSSRATRTEVGYSRIPAVMSRLDSDLRFIHTYGAGGMTLTVAGQLAEELKGYLALTEGGRVDRGRGHIACRQVSECDIFWDSADRLPAL